MPVPPTPLLAAMLSLALLGASCSLTTDLSGLQEGPGAVCGDGIIQTGEQCDDGNDDDDDQCASCVARCVSAHEFEDPATFHCYKYDRVTIANFNNAKDNCMNWRSNGNLVAINSKEELSFLTVKSTIYSGTWIGAKTSSSSDGYEWVTLEPWLVDTWGDEIWAPGYPKDTKGMELPWNCVSLGEDNLKWENAPCGDTRRVFCESPPVGEQAP